MGAGPDQGGECHGTGQSLGGWKELYFWNKDATHDPLWDTPRDRNSSDLDIDLIVKNDGPWLPIVPQIVIELGEASGRLPGDANQDGVVSADDYASVQSNFGNTSGLQAAVSPAAAAQAPTAHFSFNETAAGTWAISIEVTGDTAGCVGLFDLDPWCGSIPSEL